MSDLSQSDEEGLDNLVDFVGIYGLPPDALQNPRDLTPKTLVHDPFQNFPFPTKAVVVQPPNFDRPYKNAIPAFIYPHSNSCKRRQHPARVHSFVITDPFGQRLFCSCLRVYVPVSDVELACIKMRNLQLLQTDDGILDIEEDQFPLVVPEAYKPRALTVVSKFRFHYVLNQFLRVFEQELVHAKNEQMLNDLCYKVYTSLKHPMGPGLSLVLGVENYEFFFQQPRLDELPDFHINPNILFGLLEPLNVILLLNALITETSVLVLSEDTENLCHVTETLLLLLWPMTWVYVYIPIMPNLESVIGFFDSPQPYLIGASTELYKTLDINTENLVIADLDRNEIIGAEDFTEGDCTKAFPWQINWRLFRAIRDHLPMFEFFHPCKVLERIPNLPPHAVVEERPTYKNVAAEDEELSDSPSVGTGFLGHCGPQKSKKTLNDNTLKRSSYGGLGKLLSWSLPSPSLNYADMRTLSPDSDSSENEIQEARRPSIMKLLKGKNTHSSGTDTSTSRSSRSFMKSVAEQTGSNRSGKVKVELLYHSQHHFAQYRSSRTSNNLSLPPNAIHLEYEDRKDSFGSGFSERADYTMRTYHGRPTTNSSFGIRQTPLSWTRPNAIPDLHIEEKKEHVCPVVSLYRFQRTCISVILTICKGYHLFLQIPKEKDLVRLRSFRFFDKQQFLEARKKHASTERYEKELIPFLGSFIRSQFFSVFIQERIMNEHEDFFDIEVKRKARRRHNREGILRRYSHYGFLWKQGRVTPSWRYRIFALWGNELAYWEPTKATSALVNEYTKALENSDLTKRDVLKTQLKSILVKKERLGYLTLNDSTEIDIPQNPARHFPTTNKVPTNLSFEIVLTEPSQRRLLCCTEETNSRQLWMDLIKTRTRSSLNRVVDQFIHPKIRTAMLENKIKHKKIESIMDPTAMVICDAPHPKQNSWRRGLQSMVKRERTVSRIPIHKRQTRLRSNMIMERRPESLPRSNNIPSGPLTRKRLGTPESDFGLQKSLLQKSRSNVV